MQNSSPNPPKNSPVSLHEQFSSFQARPSAAAVVVVVVVKQGGDEEERRERRKEESVVSYVW